MPTNDQRRLSSSHDVGGLFRKCDRALGIVTTATLRVERLSLGPAIDADALDFPLERNAARLENPAPDLLAERFEIGGGRVPKIGQKITVHRRHLSAADLQTPASGLVDQFPGLQSRRILECRAAGLLADRLRGLARPGGAL